jgi:crotonobetainyl-CoA:carnitine CoA-transferase CaiB-like acyl-CoA transferase
MSGLMSITGDPKGQPTKVGVAATDVFTGVYASTAILAALHQRHATGEGQHIDMALLDVAVSVTTNQAMNYLSTGTAPGRLGNFHPNLSPYQVFDCADGYIIIAVGNDRQFARLCDLLGCAELAEQEDYATNPARVSNRDTLDKLLTERTRSFTKSDLLAACEAQGVPAGPINDMAEVFDDPQVKARGMRVDPEGVPGVRSPFKFSAAELNLSRPSPKLGQDNES